MRIVVFLLGLNNFVYGGIIQHNWFDGIFGFFLLGWGISGVTYKKKSEATIEETP